MVDVRYLGFVLGKVDSAPQASDGGLGRYVPLAEPMPVGTQVVVGDVRCRISRVDDAQAGAWLLPVGVARKEAVPASVTPTAAASASVVPAPVLHERTQPDAVPHRIDPELTVPDAASLPALGAQTQPQPETIEAEPAGEGEAEAEEGPADRSEPGVGVEVPRTPETTDDKRSGRKRRPKKTVLGR